MKPNAFQQDMLDKIPDFKESLDGNFNKRRDQKFRSVRATGTTTTVLLAKMA